MRLATLLLLLAAPGCRFVIPGLEGGGGGEDGGGDGAIKPLPDIAGDDVALVDKAGGDKGKQSDGPLDDLVVADEAMPDQAMPDLAMPDGAMPDLAMPDLALPDQAMPDLRLPDLRLPDLAMPDLRPRVIAFGPAVVTPIANIDPFSLDVGLIDGDANLDVVVADQGTGMFGGVVLLRGNGAGGFSSVTSVGVSTNPTTVRVGNLTGNASLDVAAANYGADTITIFRGDGSGALTVATTVGTGAHPWNLRLADMNNAGGLDLVVIHNLDDNVGVCLNSAAGSFGTFAPIVTRPVPTGGKPHGLAVAFFDANGNRDVAVVDNGTDQLSLFPGVGDGTLGIRTDLALTGTSNSEGVVAVDLTGDGRPELAYTQRGKGQIGVMTNDGSGAFSGNVVHAVGNDPVDVIAADFDGDGNLDLAVANYNKNVIAGASITVLPGLGNGSFGNAITLAIADTPYELAVGDFNNDGKIDLAAVARKVGGVYVYLNVTP